MKNKQRLDLLLVQQGLAETRTKAQALIMSGQVYVNNQKADKPGASFAPDVELSLRGNACPYVSRGGLKLEKALKDFGLNPAGYVCSDSGASTGGFTDCLLQHGAAKVFAIDVGYGQLAWSLRSDPPRCHHGTDQYPLCDAGGFGRALGFVRGGRFVYFFAAGAACNPGSAEAHRSGALPH